MKYAGCVGLDVSCKEDSSDPKCAACAEDYTLSDSTWQQQANGPEGQAACTADLTSDCTYTFRRSLAAERCISGMCSGNTDATIDPDVSCPAPWVPKHPGALQTLLSGRTVEECCAIRDTCIGNTDNHTHPDVVCPGLFELKPGASEIIGRDVNRCCEVRGKCTGNTHDRAEPDVACPAPQDLKPDAHAIDGRSASTCCETRGKCTGNTDALHEPDVACTSPQVLVPGAASISAREAWACCHAVGQCTDNTDALAEPDLVCSAPSVLRPGSSTRAGRDEASCCHITGKCAGNSDQGAEPDVPCEYPTQAVALYKQGRSARQCCFTSGMCTDNSDLVAEPDVECCTPSVKVQKPWLQRGRGAECCQCNSDITVASGICVASAESWTAESVTADNICTRVMVHADCGDHDAVVACARYPDGAGCAACAEVFPYNSFHYRSLSHDAQDLCMAVSQYNCVYLLRSIVWPHQPHNRPVFC